MEICKLSSLQKEYEQLYNRWPLPEEPSEEQLRDRNAFVASISTLATVILLHHAVHGDEVEVRRRLRLGLRYAARFCEYWRGRGSVPDVLAYFEHLDFFLIELLGVATQHLQQEDLLEYSRAVMHPRLSPHVSTKTLEGAVCQILRAATLGDEEALRAEFAAYASLPNCSRPLLESMKAPRGFRGAIRDAILGSDPVATRDLLANEWARYKRRSLKFYRDQGCIAVSANTSHLLAIFGYVASCLMPGEVFVRSYSYVRELGQGMP